MNYILGVDGGTSKTKALICQPDGKIVGHARTMGSNIYEGDPEIGLAHAMQAPEDALNQAGLPAESLETSVFSMSGADWPEDFMLFRASARAKGLGRKVTVVNDSIGGMYAGMPSSRCVAIICGTHAACAARGEDGTIWHNSFWQMIGGAHNLGSATLRAVYKAELGVVESTSLTRAVLDYFDEASVESLLHRQTALFKEEFPDVALLTSLLLDHAAGGDPVARNIVEDHGHELAKYATAAARKVGIDQQHFELVLGGSVFRHASNVLSDAIGSAMRQTAPDFSLSFARHEPVVGALLLALENHGTVVDDTVVSNLIDSLPGGWY
ncbi:MAG: BadF/BadG/BcrA/BcrD ATPase family protein [Thermomicrobiales bacterium]